MNHDCSFLLCVQVTAMLLTFCGRALLVSALSFNSASTIMFPLCLLSFPSCFALLHSLPFLLHSYCLHPPSPSFTPSFSPTVPHALLSFSLATPTLPLPHSPLPQFSHPYSLFPLLLPPSLFHTRLPSHSPPIPLLSLSHTTPHPPCSLSLFTPTLPLSNSPFLQSPYSPQPPALFPFFSFLTVPPSFTLSSPTVLPPPALCFPYYFHTPSFTLSSPTVLPSSCSLFPLLLPPSLFHTLLSHSSPTPTLCFPYYSHPPSFTLVFPPTVLPSPCSLFPLLLPIPSALLRFLLPPSLFQTPLSYSAPFPALCFPYYSHPPSFMLVFPPTVLPSSCSLFPLLLPIPLLSFAFYSHPPSFKLSFFPTIPHALLSFLLLLPPSLFHTPLSSHSPPIPLLSLSLATPNPPCSLSLFTPTLPLSNSFPPRSPNPCSLLPLLLSNSFSLPQFSHPLLSLSHTTPTLPLSNSPSLPQFSHPLLSLFLSLLPPSLFHTLLSHSSPITLLSLFLLLLPLSLFWTLLLSHSSPIPCSLSLFLFLLPPSLFHTLLPSHSSPIPLLSFSLTTSALPLSYSPFPPTVPSYPLLYCSLHFTLLLLVHCFS